MSIFHKTLPIVGVATLLGAQSLLGVIPDQKAQECLLSAYPSYLKEIKNNQVVWKDGSVSVWNDGKSKTYDEAFVSADMHDQFQFPYPLIFGGVPVLNQDASRLRVTEFFKKMYGDTAEAVTKNLRDVPWLPNLQKGVSFKVTTVNGIDKKIERISAKIEQLPPEKRTIALKSSGAFYWRPIAGTSNLSMHSFGIALDINADANYYWEWDLKKLGKLDYRNQMPEELVKIFEAEGFIWGGKWGHYDTMHFEYRPEIVNCAE